MHTLISAAAAVFAGVFLAVGGVLQQRAASSRPSGERHFIVHLLREKWWLLGIGATGVSYGLQALALIFGPLALVQPLVVSELVFAVPFSVRLRGLRLGLRDWLAAGAVVAGLAIGIVAADPKRGNPLASFGVWVIPIIIIVALAIVAMVVSHFVHGPVAASAVAAGGAFMMALQSALYNATIALIAKVGFFPIFVHWQPYALIVASVTGALLIQRAFRAGPLAASSPVIDSILPLGATALGIVLFGDQVRTSAWALIGAAVGIVLLITGIIVLDTSPVVRKEQEIEHEEQEKAQHQQDDPSGEQDRSGHGDRHAQHKRQGRHAEGRRPSGATAVRRER